MKSLNQLVNNLREDIPESAYIEFREYSEFDPNLEELTAKSLGCLVVLNESQCDRVTAMNLFERIRGKLIGLEGATFREELDIEWQYSLEFIVQSVE